ncbi:ester cyclase [Pseudanabaena sp. UWO311]|uniref:ester cyclase n=1 Tax=Pseudanabaena sp. UWO311 TaxID=2487337 RepID=UPI00115B8145|nr:ester cyclase [Pseudanabaena sp. UWO311]TYQ27761.1 ester cyclase [Pseudanabaena sp. UWO311]
MSDTDKNKQIIQNFVRLVWNGRDLSVLKDFWTEDCVNHAMAGTDNRGLNALRIYHDSFFDDFFSAFPDIQIEIVQQVAEGDRIATYITSQGTHRGDFYGIPPTGKHISTSVIRIDRIQDGKIAEHWSVSDAASLMQQIKS